MSESLGCLSPLDFITPKKPLSPREELSIIQLATPPSGKSTRVISPEIVNHLIYWDNDDSFNSTG